MTDENNNTDRLNPNAYDELQHSPPLSATDVGQVEGNDVPFEDTDWANTVDKTANEESRKRNTQSPLSAYDLNEVKGAPSVPFEPDDTANTVASRLNEQSVETSQFDPQNPANSAGSPLSDADLGNVEGEDVPLEDNAG